MKLKSEMQRLATITAPMGTDDDLFHDAAAAHALMQAMREREDEFSYDGYSHDSMRKRADSLMRSWGFDSGEVE